MNYLYRIDIAKPNTSNAADVGMYWVSLVFGRFQADEIGLAAKRWAR